MPLDGDNLAKTSAGALMRELALFAARAGYGAAGSIPEAMTFIQWCEDLADKGLKVDNKPFSLERRPSLVPIYEAIPTTRAQAQRFTLVIRKGAQLGLTVWEMLADLYMAIKFEPLVIGMFMPSAPLAIDKSKRRFLPIVRSIPDIHRKLTTRIDGDRVENIGEGNVQVREFGTSAFLFLWTSGGVTTESRPMDVVSFDEVQDMTLEEIDRTLERMSGSEFRLALLLSTANIPDLDIDYWFKLGNQEAWRTRCFTCHSLNDLSEHFPKCVEYNTGQVKPIRCDGVEHVPPMNEWVYICPDCKGFIHDTQIGMNVAARPEIRHIRSFHISQITSPTITARDMAEQWNRCVTGDQRKTFFNRKLGRPYIDADQLPVTMEHCLKAAAAGKAIGLKWETRGAGCVMGIDQMGGFNAVIIKKRLRDGRQAVVHCEAIFEERPFDRCTELMKHFGVEVCVVEQLPNVNDARAFANHERHRGRVFLAGYSGDAKADMITWGDEITTSDRRTAVEDRSRYMVTLQQYKAMQASLIRIRDGHCLFPDPGELEQDVIERGESKRILLLRDWVFLHFTKTALVVEMDDEERKARPRVMKVGLDPHFSFANMLCDVAWSRSHGAGMMILPNAPGAPGDDPADPADAVARSMPGLPASVVGMMQRTPGTCGSCSSFDAGQCRAQGFMVKAKDIACPLYTEFEP